MCDWNKKIDFKNERSKIRRLTFYLVGYINANHAEDEDEHQSISGILCAYVGYQLCENTKAISSDLIISREWILRIINCAQKLLL